MSPEAQRIAIAEACGWRDITKDTFSHYPSLCGFNDSNGKTEREYEFFVWGIPHYLDSLEAMQEAGEALTADQRRWFCNHLRQICGNDGAICATAAQRAEAFLRAVEKWQD